MKKVFEKDYEIVKYNSLRSKYRSDLQNYFAENLIQSQWFNSYFESGRCIFTQALSSKKIVGSILYSPQQWESDILNKSVVKIDQFLVNVDKHNQKYNLALLLLNKFFKWCKKDKIGMVTIRIDENEVSLIHALETVGFRTIESLLTFERANNSIPKFLDRCRIVSYKEKYLESLQRIAYSSFQYSRFHADPMICPETAKLSRSEWIVNSCHGRAEKVFVAQKQRKIVGFIACRPGINFNGNNVGIIDLIATDPDHKRQGIALSLVKEAIEYYSKKKYKLIVGTQAKNIPSVNLYIKLGFRLIKSQLTLVKYFN
ncbi:dTDP-fucosamine acetyltransferase [subsurface metagenome]